MSRHKKKIRENMAILNPPADIDVVIPAYGNPELLLEAVGSLMLNQPPVNLFVVDDSTPLSTEYEKALESIAAFPRTRVIRQRVNEGFIVTSNHGASKGKARFLVHMNADVKLKPGALKELLIPLHHDAVGVVGGRLLFPEDSTADGRPAGRIQHAGLVFDAYLRPQHVHIGWGAEHPRVIVDKEMQAVTGALFATPRALWETLGGFDVVYGRGTCEDVDYCLRARAAGKGVVYKASAVAYHHVGASSQLQPATNQFPLRRNLEVLHLRCGQAILWDGWRFW